MNIFWNFQMIYTKCFKCFSKHFAPKSFTPFIKKLTLQTFASLSLSVPVALG